MSCQLEGLLPALKRAQDVLARHPTSPTFTQLLKHVKPLEKYISLFLIAPRISSYRNAQLGGTSYHFDIRT